MLKSLFWSRNIIWYVDIDPNLSPPCPDNPPRLFVFCGNHFSNGCIWTKHLNLVEQINRKNLKIPVFGGLRVNLVVFEFVPMIPQENLVKFDLWKNHFQYIWENLNLVFLIETKGHSEWVVKIGYIEGQDLLHAGSYRRWWTW